MSVMLQHPRVVKVESNRRYVWDKRRRYTWAVVSYQGSDGNEYRKGFYFEAGMTTGKMDAMIPRSGTNEEISTLSERPVMKNPSLRKFKVRAYDAQGNLIAKGLAGKTLISRTMKRKLRHIKTQHIRFTKNPPPREPVPYDVPGKKYTLFKDIKVGTTFDFISGGMFDSFPSRCIKTSARTYRALETGTTYGIGSGNTKVYHVKKKNPEHIRGAYGEIISTSKNLRGIHAYAANHPLRRVTVAKLSNGGGKLWMGFENKAEYITTFASYSVLLSHLLNWRSIYGTPLYYAPDKLMGEVSAKNPNLIYTVHVSRGFTQRNPGLSRKDIYVEKTAQGYLLVSAIVDGQRVSKKYMYYTRRDAIKDFREEIKRRKIP